MSNWVDLFSLLVTIGVLGGAVYGIIYAVNMINEGVNSTKESLKNRGLHITDKGVSVKTSKRFNIEDERDAAQRGIMKAMSAGTFKKGEVQQAPPMERTDSNSSSKSSKNGSVEKEKKRRRGVFGSKS